MDTWCSESTHFLVQKAKQKSIIKTLEIGGD